MSTYEGWSNYPTWATKLWLDNDEGLYRDMVELSRSTPDVYDLANAVHDYVEELLPDLSGLAADLLRSAFEDISFREIAEALHEDNPPDNDDEPDEDSITTEDHRTFYQYGKVVFTLTEDEDVNAGIKRELDRMNFWPDVFWISDHGNAHLIEYWED
jgi:hypothetical protein